MRFAAGHDLPDARTMRRAGDAWAELMGQTLAEARAGYDMAGLPVMTPETWRMYREHADTNRGHHPAACPLCAFFGEVELSGHIAAWRESVPVMLPGRPRWGSAESALERYWAIICDGYPAGSVTASIIAFGAHGCWVQRGERTGSAAEDLADDVAAVESALRYAYRATVSWRHHAAVLLARRASRQPIEAGEVAAAMGLRSVDVGAIVRTGMRGVRANLAARGLIPMPRPGSRAHLEAAELRRTYAESKR